MSESKKKKLDVDVNADLDLDAHVDVDIDKDVDISHTNTNIDVHAHGYAKAYIERVDVDIDKSYSEEYKKTHVYKEDIDVDVDKDISEETWNVKVDVHSDNIIQHSKVSEVQDVDVNDIDNNELIEVDDWGYVSMDDFTSDQLAIGNSLNGEGNDSQFSANQSNNLDDSDHVSGTKATFNTDGAPINQHFHNSNSSGADADADAYALGIGKGGAGGDGGNGGPAYYYKPAGDGGDGGKGGLGLGAAGAAAGALAVNKSDASQTVNNYFEADDGPFQKVAAHGGHASSGDGIATIKGSHNASGNEGDGTISGDSSASGNGAASAEAFTASVLAGGNQQANFATVNVTGGDEGFSHPGYDKGHGHGKDGDGPATDSNVLDPNGGLAIKDSHVSSYLDNDVNDLDSSELIDVNGDGILHMDDFDLDVTAIGGSLNGGGNDMQFSFDQTNDLVDNDYVHNTTATYNGTFLDGPLQEVHATGGSGHAGNGIGDASHLSGSASNNGGDGAIAGSTAGSADAIASAEAFTANVVVGANVQVNNLSSTIVGGDSAEVDALG